jgi:nucleoside-diphosphate-sugar epimerase
MADQRVLVTGADGFIGSHLTEALVRQGYAVRAFVLYNSFNSWGWLDHCAADVKGRFEVFAGDIRDPHGVKEAMKGCDAVLHLAALIAIPYSYHSPDTYVDTNVKGTLNVLQAARELGVKRVVHTSTSEVYGTARFVPITEAHPLQGQSPYSATKIAADQLAYSFYASFGLPVVIARPFNIHWHVATRGKSGAQRPTLAHLHYARRGSARFGHAHLRRHPRRCWRGRHACHGGRLHCAWHNVARLHHHNACPLEARAHCDCKFCAAYLLSRLLWN